MGAFLAADRAEQVPAIIEADNGGVLRTIVGDISFKNPNSLSARRRF